AREIPELRINLYVCQHTANIDRSQCSYVGNRELVTRDKFAPFELSVHPFEPSISERALLFPVFGELLEAAAKERPGVPPRLSDKREHLQFHPPIPHLDVDLLAKITSEQVRFRVKSLQVAANRDRFRKVGAIVEFQHRHPTRRILFEKLGCTVL